MLVIILSLLPISFYQVALWQAKLEMAQEASIWMSSVRPLLLYLTCIVYSDLYYIAISLADGPSLALGPPQYYVLLGDSASLVCGTGLDSNPQATITWTAPDRTTIVDNINARYDKENGPTFVRLNFTNATKSDSGVWRCEVIVMSERHIFSEGQFILQNQSLIGSITKDIQLTVISELH